MAYSKQTWATGDVITAAKLNHMEDGIAAGDAFFVTFTISTVSDEQQCTCDKTYSEISSAFNAGKNIIVKCIDADNNVIEYPSYFSIEAAGFTAIFFHIAYVGTGTGEYTIAIEQSNTQIFLSSVDDTVTIDSKYISFEASGDIS